MFILVSFIIIVGGLTRLTDSGLSGMLHYKEISYDENIDNLKKFKKNDILHYNFIKDCKIYIYDKYYYEIYYWPVEPNPPAPLEVELNLFTNLIWKFGDKSGIQICVILVPMFTNE